MKKLITLVCLTGMCLVVNSQSSDKVTSSTKVVINQKMLDNFNRVEYPADQIDFNFILTHYTIDEAKEAIIAYHSGEIETTTVQSVEKYLAENKKDIIGFEKPVPIKIVNSLLAKH
jgi:hypothetical protein